uniref:Ig-like domain-containing protein n=2 Tax=Meloidogyne enterolobii TaxID=390850 RepID=A0A6V7U664_MELEN|nr:unnamed protein product [Meloidogyne enterolobii]
MLTTSSSLFYYFNKNKNYYYFPLLNLIKKLIHPCLNYYRQNKIKFPYFLLLILLSTFPNKNEANNNIQRRHSPFAQGNLFVVFDAKSGRSSTQSPQMANLSALWCQATSNGKDVLRIKEARFVRVLPKPEEIHEASRYNGARTRAFLEFDSPAPITSVGKYRCEINTTTNTEEGEEKRVTVVGNLFVNMRPVLILNATTRLDQVEDGNFFSWIGSAKTVPLGGDVFIECPAIGYPLPEIRWFKDNRPLNTSVLLPPDKMRKTISSRRKYVLTAKALYIRSIDVDDEATYKCLATNSFTEEFGRPPREFQVTLEHYVRIPLAMSWIIPLIIIIASLLLLALIIWGCSQKDRNKRNQYNVAQKEKKHFRASGGEGGRPPTEDELDD